MEKEKRYVITLDLFLYAYTDEEVKTEANHLIRQINNMKSDSNASVLSINEAKFGTIGISRIVK